MTPSLTVVEHFLPFPGSIAAEARALPFSTVEWAGHQYQGVGVLPHFGPWELVSEAVGYRIVPRLSFFRQGRPGDRLTVAIHADRAAAGGAGICYFDEVGGTAFWRHRPTGWETLPPAEQLGEDAEKACDVLNEQGKDLRWWEMTGYVAARPNRFIAYPSDRFHSRWPIELDRERLIWVVFFDLA